MTRAMSLRRRQRARPRWPLEMIKNLQTTPSPPENRRFRRLSRLQSRPPEGWPAGRSKILARLSISPRKRLRASLWAPLSKLWPSASRWQPHRRRGCRGSRWAARARSGSQSTLCWGRALGKTASRSCAPVVYDALSHQRRLQRQRLNLRGPKLNSLGNQRKYLPLRLKSLPKQIRKTYPERSRLGLLPTMELRNLSMQVKKAKDYN